jgi:TPR repeat protein
MAALADLYEAGNGVPKNKVEAAKWYAKAAAAGHAYALYALAECYKDGNGVPQSTDKARELYSQAAEKGYSPARSALLDLDEEEK